MNNFSASKPQSCRHLNLDKDAVDKGESGEDEDKEQQKQQQGGARCEWEIALSAVISSTNVEGASVSDALGVIEFDHSNTVFATAGISRKIRIYRLESLLAGGSEDGRIGFLDHGSVCDYYICTPAKLSSLRWKPRSGGGVIGSGDYDGVVMEYDLEKRLPIFERDEHGGRRIWSVDYSHWDPTLGASGSDDGSFQMWDSRSEGGRCVAAVHPSVGRAVCCVEFNPFGGSMIAVGCADRRVYGYDIRMLTTPVITLNAHSKTVTYVKFLDGHTLVSSSIDGHLKMWDLDDMRMVRKYKGHVNNRNFVGLSVWRNGGLLGCGSENNQVFVYDKRWGEPIWVHGFETMATYGSNHGFVGSVCWRQVGDDSCTLLAGGSNGVLQVFDCKRKTSI
ncbi:hypothetical protein K2173_008511 [Erythroxylum novogranatense]|uniref:Uncharacterized protein n=1 Tax=Erythroxylum novogranatense TaxID=1862640 RepID=A0AAV8SL97_9ROSI|nr:hypothetical protein K2173_008511 [Erythroxylum novogranatense]